MKRLVSVLVISFIFVSNSFSGDVSRQRTSASSTFFYPSAYGIRLLNSLGNSGLENSTANLGFMNPASIAELSNYSFGLSYQVNTPVYFPEPNDDISMPRVYNLIPQSFGAVYHYDKLSFGLSLGQEVNTAFNFGEIPVTTSQFPDGTGIVYIPIIENTVEKYSLSVAYDFGNSAIEDTNLIIGLRYNFNRLHSYEKIDKVEADKSVFSSGFEIGLLFLPNDIWKLGISFKSAGNFTIIYERYNLFNPDSLRDPNYYEVDIPDRVIKMPSEINLDALFQLQNDLRLTASINNIFWNSSNSFFDNQLDISSNLIYNFSDIMTGSAGLLVSNIFKVTRANEFNALFFMAGLKFNYETFNIDLAVADSHLISGQLRKQFIAKVGVGVQF